MRTSNLLNRSVPFIFGLVLLSFVSTAQTRKNDIIVKRDSVKVEASIIAVTELDVQYKKASDPQGPVFYISKSDIARIHYGNGETETFAKSSYKPQQTREKLIMYPMSPWTRRDFTDDLSIWNSEDLRKAYQFYNFKTKSSKRIGAVFGILGVAATVTGIVLVSNSNRRDIYGFTHYDDKRQIGTSLIVAGLATGISVGIASAVGTGKYRRKANIVAEELIERKEPLKTLSFRPAINLATKSAGLSLVLTF